MSKDKEMNVVYVKVSDIIEKFNPKSRTSTKALEQLEREIRIAGIEDGVVGKILVPLALTKDGVLADGHRRLQIARKLGIEYVPCIYYDIDDNMQLWGLLNRGMKKIESGTWTEAVDDGLPIRYTTSKVQSDLIGLQRILQPDEYQKFIRSHRGSGILVNAYKVSKYCGDTSDSFVREILLWIMETHQFTLLRSAIRDGLDPDRVIELILDRERMVRGWVVEKKR